MSFNARILADSISPAGHRLTTFEGCFPRFILAEVNTHKMISKNSASSRAVPVLRRIAMLQSDPFVPEAFGKNRAGMQPGEALEGDVDAAARDHWGRAMSCAIEEARALEGINVHKQYANRLLEPFLWHTAILSGTDWQNLWNLRVHPAAQGEFQKIARIMRDLYDASEPRLVGYEDDWHLPMVEGPEHDEFNLRVDGLKGRDLAKISAARCGRVSFLTHDGTKNPPAKDIERADSFIKDGHLSPLEHSARPMTEWELRAYEQFEADFNVEGEGVRTMRVSKEFLHQVRDMKGPLPGAPMIALVSTPKRVHYCGNFNGWVQLRKLVPGEAVFKP